MVAYRFVLFVVSCLFSFSSPEASAQQPPTFEALDAKVGDLMRRNRPLEAAALAGALEQASRQRFGEQSARHADTLHNIAAITTANGQFGESERLLKLALDIKTRSVGADHASIADLTNDLGTLYARLGRLQEAEQNLRRSLQIDLRRLRPDHLTIVGTRGNLASVLGDQRRFAEAEAELRAAISAADRPTPQHRQKLAFLLSVASSQHLEERRYREAEPLLKREITLLLEEPQRNEAGLSNAYSNLSNVMSATQRPGEAENLLRKSMEIDARSRGPEHSTFVASWNNLGVLQRNTGKTAEAEQSFRRAIAIHEKVGPSAISFGASALLNLGELLVATGRIDEGDRLLERACDLSRRRQGPHHPNSIQCLHARSRAAVARKDETRALEFARDATRSVVHRTQAQRSATGPAGEAAAVRPQAFVIVNLLERLSVEAARDRSGPISDEAGREAFIAAQWPTQSLAGAAVSQMAARFSEGNTPLAAAIRESQDLDQKWRTTEARFASALGATTGGDASLSALRGELASIEQRQMAISTRIARDFPDYAALTRADPLSAADVQRHLRPGEALLKIYTTANATYVWAISPQKFAWHAVPVSASEITTRVAALRAMLEVRLDTITDPASADRLFDPAAAHDLYRLLLAPVETVLADTTHAFVAASGPMTTIPLHVLVTERFAPGRPTPSTLALYADVKWLGERFATSVLPTVSSLAALRRIQSAEPAPEALIGFADPVFNADSGRPSAALATRPAEVRSATRSSKPRPALPAVAFNRYFRGANLDVNLMRQSLTQLPETADEVRKVAARLGAPERDIRLGHEANERVVKQTDLSRYRVVYFATHGLVAGELQGFGEPSLALTIPDRPSPLDDGLLTSSEIAALKLRADWVVLSACNTAAGGTTDADALSGLARSFFYAGAKTLLVTHWAVDSLAAVDLTTGTFANLQRDATIGRAEALRLSMRAMMRDTADPVNAYPGTWAPFVLVGDGGRSP